MRKIIGLIIFCMISFAHAAETQDVDAGETTEEESFEQKFIRNNIMISNWFDGMADNIDMYFVGKRMTRKKNTTSVRLENRAYFFEGQGVKYDPALNVNLRLPNVEEYWQLKFTSYDEMEEKRSGLQGAYVRPSQRERNYGATVGVFRKLGNVRTAFQPRIELQAPIKISHSLSFASTADMKTYDIQPKLELYAVADKGTGIFWALNFNFELNKKQTLSFLNEGDYVDREHMESVTNGVTLNEILTRSTSLSYSVLFFSNNRPSYHLEGYSLIVGWSHALYRNILDYQIAPHLDFYKPDSFRGRIGLTFNVSLNF